MDKYLVYQQKIDGPATHAVVIGVGKYAYLPGGDGGRRTEWHDGMGQLDSPPISARKFTDWLLKDYNNPTHKLATVSLLVSEKGDRRYTPTEGTELVVEPATINNVREAVRQWYHRGDTNLDNLLVFYFCGHGALGGAAQTLFLEDFGHDDLAPLDGAIDFTKLHRGMNRCQARYQIYFVDACRVASTTVLDYAVDSYGDPLIPPLKNPALLPVARSSSVYYSTLAGAKSYSRNNQVSQFTESLITALSCAADNAEGDNKWHVHTGNLNQGICKLIKRAVIRKEAVFQPVEQNAPIVEFCFHEPKAEPKVPVFIGCHDEKDNPRSDLTCEKKGFACNAGAGQTWGWDVYLPQGDYIFDAKDRQAPNRINHAEKLIVPPLFHDVNLEVNP
jgi:hypothetical protein